MTDLWATFWLNLQIRYREWRDSDGPDLAERLRRIWQDRERTGA